MKSKIQKIFLLKTKNYPSDKNSKDNAFILSNSLEIKIVDKTKTTNEGTNSSFKKLKIESFIKSKSIHGIFYTGKVVLYNSVVQQSGDGSLMYSLELSWSVVNRTEDKHKQMTLKDSEFISADLLKSLLKREIRFEENHSESTNKVELNRSLADVSNRMINL